MIHGGVRAASVFMTKGGEVKLGGFELATPTRNNETESLLSEYRKCLGTSATAGDWPPEMTETHRGGLSWRELQK